MAEERRKLKRKYLMFYTRVFNRRTGALLGHLADLTVEGLMLISEEVLPVNTHFDLRMDLPEGFGFPKRHLDMHGRCVWCAPDIDPHFHNAGFHLENVAEEDVTVIERLVEDYGLRE